MRLADKVKRSSETQYWISDDLFHKRKHGLIAVEDEFSMKWKAHKKAGFLNSAFEIWRDMGGFEDAADSVQTAQ